MQQSISKHPVMQPYHIESVCRIIGATDEGLTGAEISKILSDCKTLDISPNSTKWRRLYNAFITSQNSKKCSNQILNFLSASMQPSRYIGYDELFYLRLNKLNKCLSFVGLELTKESKYRNVNKATTLTDAQQRASHYKSKLELRNTNPEIMK